MLDEADRDISAIRLPKWGRVVPTEGVVPWLLAGDDGVPVEPVRQFLLDFVARGNSSGSVRSCAYVLLRWWRRLLAVEVTWDRATPHPAPRRTIFCRNRATSPAWATGSTTSTGIAPSRDRP